MGKIGWLHAKKQMEYMEKLEAERLRQMKEEAVRRNHYVKTGEWVYNIKEDIKNIKKEKKCK